MLFIFVADVVYLSRRCCLLESQCCLPVSQVLPWYWGGQRHRKSPRSIVHSPPCRQGFVRQGFRSTTHRCDTWTHHDSLIPNKVLNESNSVFTINQMGSNASFPYRCVGISLNVWEDLCFMMLMMNLLTCVLEPELQLWNRKSWGLFYVTSTLLTASENLKTNVTLWCLPLVVLKKTPHTSSFKPCLWFQRTPVGPGASFWTPALILTVFSLDWKISAASSCEQLSS